MKNKIVIIGAGAAGLMAGITASSLGADVEIIEKNQKVGRKIAITGKGRCNLTNFCDVSTFIANVPDNGKFLYSALNNFTPQDTVDFFEENGLKTKVERGNRVFPQSDKALDVVDTLWNKARNSRCSIINDTATSLLIDNGCIKGVKLLNHTLECNKVIICCGGKSYPLTGSTGDGYKFAKQAGHTIIEPTPSLIPLVSNDSDCKEMQGLSLKNVSLKVINRDNNKELYSDFGEMLFTHFGMSGPMILSASSHIKHIDKANLVAVIDLKPALNYEQLDSRIVRDFKENANRDVSNSLGKLLPRKMISVVIKRWGINFDKKCNVVTKEERHKLVDILKGFEISINGT